MTHSNIKQLMQKCQEIGFPDLEVVIDYTNTCPVGVIEYYGNNADLCIQPGNAGDTCNIDQLFMMLSYAVNTFYTSKERIMKMNDQTKVWAGNAEEYGSKIVDLIVKDNYNAVLVTEE